MRPLLLLAGALLAAGCAAPAAPFPFDPLPLPAASAAAPSASASPGPARTPDDDRVTFTLLPYAWRADARGEARADGIEASTDDDEESTVRGGRVEAHLDRVALLLDGFWAHAGAEDAGIEGDARYGRFDLSVALRLVGDDPAPVADRAGPVAAFADGIAGLRTHFAGLHADPPGFPVFDRDVAWIEPMAGGRAGVTVLRRLTLFGRADASGIGYEDWASASWGAEAGVRLDLAAGLGLVAGARWARVRIGEDSDDDGFDETRLDLRLKGLWAGIVWEF
jgi:hypothetical protein